MFQVSAVPAHSYYHFYPHHLLNPYHFLSYWEDSSLLRCKEGFLRCSVVLIKACLHWSYMQFSGSNS